MTHLDLAPTDGGDNFRYEYGCSTYEGAVLTCTQFYTDLTSEDEAESSVGSLKLHAVTCYDGSALQKFRYQTVTLSSAYFIFIPSFFVNLMFPAVIIYR